MKIDIWKLIGGKRIFKETEFNPIGVSSLEITKPERFNMVSTLFSGGWRTIKGVTALWLCLAALILVTACAPARQANPEKQACIRGCSKERNACVLNATNSANLTECDNQARSCMQECAKLPDFLPLKPNP